MLLNMFISAMSGGGCLRLLNIEPSVPASDPSSLLSPSQCAPLLFCLLYCLQMTTNGHYWSQLVTKNVIPGHQAYKLEG